MTSGVAYDAASLAGLAFIALALLSAVLLVAWWRGSLRRRGRAERVGALAGLTLFLCFDLVCFGSYTRLSNAGLGCPDWPGCYATASPVAAARSIDAAEAVAPEGPVTQRKAWIEMIHRYFALALGALIMVLLAATIAARRERPTAWRWAMLTLGWVVLQGAFGALTVTWKLYPAVVTAHLLGGMGLLALLAWQAQPAPTKRPARAASSPCADRSGPFVLGVAAAVLVAQVALGGWVSTNYAVLACTGFPTCNGRWWPAMDWADGFTLLRELGRRADGQWIPLSALVAIQMAHRLFAIVVVLALGGLAWRCSRGAAHDRRRGAIIAALLVLQVATGVANVTLGWPLAGALLHTAGAAALVMCVGREAALAWGARRRRAESIRAVDTAIPLTTIR